MTVGALGMALFPKHPTLAPIRNVPLAPGAPTRSSSNPADLRLAHGTLQPVAAPLFHHDHLQGKGY